jgi:4-hydroxyphenylpyruvate dioxygenase
MTDIFDNPLGINGFEFVEYAAPDTKLLEELFKSMGFTAIARHRERKVTLYRQGEINFLVNEEPDSFAADFARKHGPCACGFAIRVNDSQQALAHALQNDATEITADMAARTALNMPMIEGIGGSILYLTDDAGGDRLYEKDFEFFPDVDRNPKGFGLTIIDHLTHNVYPGNMDVWAGFYEKIFGFREIRYFDIKGSKTGLISRAMTAPDGIVRIPINEATDDKSQIAEYLEEYEGEGIQHVALFAEDIYFAVEAMHARNIDFLTVPQTYFELVDERIPGHGEDLERMARNGILIDADVETKKQLLLQIFTKTCIGPIFFEIIQRKGNEGFGEGNFQALFDSIELDQEQRGVL